MAELRSMYVYPIKGVRRVEVEQSFVERRGLARDRRWMVVDERNQFLSQREVPAMATVKATLEETGLNLRAEGFGAVSVPTPTGPCNMRVVIWNDICDAIAGGEVASDWMSEVLHRKCALAYMPDESKRPVNVDYAPSPGEDIVSFADGFPVLLTSDDSLRELNARMDIPIPMNRFRPNLVVSGFTPFDEDNWGILKIGNVRFHATKCCLRCKVTTTDQDTGALTSNEPLKTLATFRKFGSHVAFGVNLVPLNVGQLEVGETVVIETRS